MHFVRHASSGYQCRISFHFKQLPNAASSGKMTTSPHHILDYKSERKFSSVQTRFPTRSGFNTNLLYSHKPQSSFLDIDHVRMLSWSPFSKQSSTENKVELPVTNSSVEPTVVSNSTSTGYLPDPPFPVDMVMDSNVVFNALGEPTLSSLGLANSWWPTSWIQHILENIHVLLEIPWWAAIVLFVIPIRLMLTPMVIDNKRKMLDFQISMRQFKEMWSKIKEAKDNGDYFQMMRLRKEFEELGKPNMPLMLPLIQMPIFLSVFNGLREMCNLPVQSMQTGGLLWFENLTIADPTLLLPIITSLTMLLTLEVGIESSPTSMMSPNTRWILRFAVPTVTIVCTSQFATAICFYWATSNAFSLVQAFVISRPAVKKYLNLPEPLPEPAETSKSGTSKGFMENYREYMEFAKGMQFEDKRKNPAQTMNKRPLKTFADKKDK
jgi:YidC/Oxa1 family membrane protein insertase